MDRHTRASPIRVSKKMMAPLDPDHVKTRPSQSVDQFAAVN
jgi:hypothetical protein